MKLQRLAQELLRHFGLWPPPVGTGGSAAGALQTCEGGPAAGGDGSDEWQVLLFPDLSAHGHLKNTSWGPSYPHELTVRPWDLPRLN